VKNRNGSVTGSNVQIAVVGRYVPRSFRYHLKSQLLLCLICFSGVICWLLVSLL
jgi:TRAP-type C4-dicarboxylate transport system permease small subunit